MSYQISISSVCRLSWRWILQHPKHLPLASLRFIKLSFLLTLKKLAKKPKLKPTQRRLILLLSGLHLATPSMHNWATRLYNILAVRRKIYSRHSEKKVDSEAVGLYRDFGFSVAFCKQEKLKVLLVDKVKVLMVDNHRPEEDWSIPILLIRSSDAYKLTSLRHHLLSRPRLVG